MNRKLLTLILLIACAINAQALWFNSGPEYVGGSAKILQNNSRIYLLATRLYHSDDNGNNWLVENTPSVNFNDMIFLPTKIIAATSKGLFVSYNNGVNWVSHNTGISSTDSITSMVDIAQKGSRLLLVASSRIYYSDNDGVSWIASTSTNGLRTIAIINNTILTSKITGIWQSTDNGLTFTPNSNTGIAGTNPNISDLLTFNNSVYCISGSSAMGLYKSSDEGVTWQLFNTGIGGTNILSSIRIVNSKLFSRSNTGLYELNTSTNNWIISSLSPTENKSILHFNLGKYFAFSATQISLQTTIDDGITWINNESGIYMQTIQRLCVTSNNKLLACNAQGTFIFNPIDTTWSRFSPFSYNFGGAVTTSNTVYNLAFGAGNQYYAATDGGVWNSSDNGQTWTQHISGLPNTQFNYKTVKDLYISGDTIIAATEGGIYRSLDQANTWQQVNPLNTTDLYKYGNYLYATGIGVYRSSNNGNTWTAFAGATSGGPFDMISGAAGKIFTSSNILMFYADTMGSSFSSITGGSNFLGYGDKLFFSNSYYDVNQSLSNTISMADNLPCYYGSVALGCYNPFLGGQPGNCNIAVYGDNLWIGTSGFSTYYRSLGDFGFPVSVYETNEEETAIKVYPNPANDRILISGLSKTSEISIYNGLGQLQNINVNLDNKVIDISNLTKGFYIYLLKDKQNNFNTSGKFIKE